MKWVHMIGVALVIYWAGFMVSHFIFNVEYPWYLQYIMLILGVVLGLVTYRPHGERKGLISPHRRDRYS